MMTITTTSNKTEWKGSKLAIGFVVLLVVNLIVQSLFWERGQRTLQDSISYSRSSTVTTVPSRNAFIASSLSKHNGHSSTTSSTTKRIATSQDYLTQELDIQTCRFPSFFDRRRVHYNLTTTSSNNNQQHVQPNLWRDIEKQRTGMEAQSDGPRVKFDLERVRRYRERHPNTQLSIRRNVTFVHIGKAGGTTLGCQLQFVWGHPSGNCHQFLENNNSASVLPSSAISQHVSCYTHWNRYLKCYHIDNVDFLVNLRNPIHRIASWFLYEHVENHPMVYSKDSQGPESYHCGQLILNSCYRTFDDLTTIGLSYPRPDPSQPLKVGFNLTAQECSQWAWHTIQGTVPADYHNSFNYDWYAHRLLQTHPSVSNVYVLRLEHLKQDWKTIDQMLGGTGDIPSSMKQEKGENMAAQKSLRISSKTTTTIGRDNLCRALCDELQAYQRILHRAVNLQPQDVNDSIQELHNICPNYKPDEPCQY